MTSSMIVCGSSRKLGVPYFGVLKGTILGSPIFGNPLLGTKLGHPYPRSQV